MAGCQIPFGTTSPSPLSGIDYDYAVIVSGPGYLRVEVVFAEDMNISVKPVVTDMEYYKDSVPVVGSSIMWFTNRRIAFYFQNPDPPLVDLRLVYKGTSSSFVGASGEHVNAFDVTLPFGAKAMSSGFVPDVDGGSKSSYVTLELDDHLAKL